MRRRSWLARIALLTAAFAGLAGCTDTPEDPAGRGNIRAVHAVSDLGAVTFLIEGIPLTQSGLNFHGATSFVTYDSLSYDFNFDYQSGATGDLERIASTPVSVQPNTNYTLVLTGTAQAPRVLTLQQPEPTLDPAGTALEVWFGNLSSVAGPVDVYVGTAGFDPAVETPRAQGLALESFSAIAEIDSDEYEIVATVAGQPGSVLIRSEVVNLSAGDRILINLLDAAGETTGDYVFGLAGEIAGARIVAQDAPVELKLVHSAFSVGNIDLYIDEPLTTPLFADIPFGFVSAATEVPEADDEAQFTITTTAAGNVGAPLSSALGAVSDANLSILFYTGVQGDNTLRVQPVATSRRPVFDSARVGFFNGIQNTARVSIFLVEPGEDFRNVPAQFGGATPSQSQSLQRLQARAYELYAVDALTGEALLGPMDIELAVGDVRQLVFVDTADPTVADVIDINLLDP